MRRLAALVWLMVVLSAATFLGFRIHDGLTFRTDLLALLPQEERDPVVQQAKNAVSDVLGRRLIALVGHADPAAARAAAARLSDDLAATALVAPVDETYAVDRLKRLGALYFPYRRGLLAEGDRAALMAGDGEAIAERALAQAYGFVGLTDAGLLRADPFLLLPAFFADLPMQRSRLHQQDGSLSVTEGGKTWVLVAAELLREPFELEVQSRVVGAFDAAVRRLQDGDPGIEVRRLGAVFFADAGARTALGETSLLATLSIGGAVLLMLAVFRRPWPLLHNVLALAVGIGVGLAGSVAIFGELHVAALLFGTSLIGVAVDYGLHYSVGLFDPEMRNSRERLGHVRSGMLIGLVTTLIGYLLLASAPFPGLRQIAVMSGIGLTSAFLTVMLWLPLLDRSPPLGHGAVLLNAADRLWAFWTGRRLRAARAAILILVGAIAALGLMRLNADDDVRLLQALSPTLLREQDEVQALIGATAAAQFLLVDAADEEAALRREEALRPVLDRLVADGSMAGFVMPAAFVPSAGRQRDNAALVATALERPLLAAQVARLGIEEPPTGGDGILTLAQVLDAGVAPFLDQLVLSPGLHVVGLQGLVRPEAVARAVAGVAGVRFVDPTADFSALLGKYRHRALLLTGFAALLMVPVLVWRYGWRGGLLTMVPAAAGVLLALAAVGLIGQPLTFFHSIALILILSIGIDYGVFCAESGGGRRAVTLLGIWLATLTTLLSFGLLAFSAVAAVHSFGLTMLVGISTAFLLSPIVGSLRIAPRAVPLTARWRRHPFPGSGPVSWQARFPWRRAS